MNSYKKLNNFGCKQNINNPNITYYVPQPTTIITSVHSNKVLIREKLERFKPIVTSKLGGGKDISPTQLRIGNYTEPPSGSYSSRICLDPGDQSSNVCYGGSERLWDNKKIITCTDKKGQRIRVDCNNGFEGNDNGFRCKEKVKAPLKTLTFSLDAGGLWNSYSRSFCAPESEKLRAGAAEIECMSFNRDNRVLLGCNSQGGGIFRGDHTMGFRCVDEKLEHLRRDPLFR